MDSFAFQNSSCDGCHVGERRDGDVCPTCGATLPWCSYEASSQAALEAEAAARQDIAMCLRTLWLLGGGMVYLFGAFLWSGNIMGFYPMIPGIGYLVMAVGIATLKRANDLG